jgi:hypothetical protein
MRSVYIFRVLERANEVISQSHLEQAITRCIAYGNHPLAFNQGERVFLGNRMNKAKEFGLITLLL